MDVGAKALLALCAEQKADVFFRERLEEKHFSDDEKAVFSAVGEHVKLYHKLPQAETLKLMFQEIPDAVEPSGYYLKKMKDRFHHRLMNKGLTEVQTVLEKGEVAKAKELVLTLGREMALEDVRNRMMNFAKEGAKDVEKAYWQKKLHELDAYVFFGWPYLDEMVAGLYPGDVVSYVGRPAVGKSWKLLYQAHNAWHVQKKPILFVSMEMDLLSIEQRLASLHTHVGIKFVKKAEMSNKLEAKFISGLKLIAQEETPLYVLDGNLTATPEQIYALAHQLQPACVFIDGAYLLRHSNHRLDRFNRVAENSELIKRYTGEAGIPSVCSYQFNREAAGKKKEKGEGVGLEHIAYSDAVGQISSIVLGLFQEDSVETLVKRRIEVLKGREGATGSFEVKWDFLNMDFSQISAEEKEEKELQFL